MTIRLHLRRLLYRFLGLFREVRELRTIEERKNAALQRAHAEIMDARTARKSVEVENANLAAQLDETRRGLTVMTESRLNADRQIELLRGILEGNSEISAREIASMKQMVDCFSLQAMGRQVFGTAPLVVRAKEEEGAGTPRGMTIRDVQRQQKQAFLDEVYARGMRPPEQVEYSSKQSANGGANVT